MLPRRQGSPAAQWRPRRAGARRHRDEPPRPQPRRGSIHLWPGRSATGRCHAHRDGSPLSRRSFSQDAGHRRPQVQRLSLDAGEASVAKPLARLHTDAFGCLGGGTGTARLRDNRHSTARPQGPAKLLEPRLWFGPHAEVVDSQRLVEHLAEITEVQGGSESQVDSALLDSSPVADGRLANHDLGVVDSEHETVGCPAGQLADRESRAEADLQDVVLRLHVQQSDGPPVPLPVGWA